MRHASTATHWSGYALREPPIMLKAGLRACEYGGSRLRRLPMRDRPEAGIDTVAANRS